MAKRFEDCGIKRLHVVDLDGAKAAHIVNYKTLESITSQTNLIVDFGGGLKTDEDLRIAFECGAAMITGGSIAVKNPDVFTGWIEKYGADRIILGADVKEKKIAVTGWLEDTELSLDKFLDGYIKKGVTKVICTDIAKDGMLKGPSIELYKETLAAHPALHLIASGGVSSTADIKALEAAKVPAVIFGKAIYEGKITFKELTSIITEP
jgi:phosphoribosylformimino-5-aminoimidazole carboxamide ribotide isomerase